MLKGLKRFGLPVVFGTALALLNPAASYARDHDRDRHERHEWREHHRYRGYYYYGPSYGYYPYAHGYYDRWGYWHPYRY
jgi:hypothetical protein